MATITEKEWEEFKELGKTLPQFPEWLDLKMTRKILQMPSSIEFFFDGYRKDIKEKIGFAEDMQEKTERLSDENLKPVFHMMMFLHGKNLEMFKEHLDIIEALAFQNIELRKDLNKLTKLTKPTKNKTEEYDRLIKKISENEKENTKFAKDYKDKLPYVNQFKDFLDHEAGDTTTD